MKTLAVMLAIFAMSVSGMAFAQSVPHGFDVLGPGAISCGTWIAQRRDAGPVMYGDEDWVLGYLTAYDEHVAPDGKISAGTDSDGLMTWIDGYCQAHPLDNLATAASALATELKARKH
jgi:hypothetical protein